MVLTYVNSSFSYGTLSREELESLGAHLDIMEIKQALFSLGAWKALGPHGFPQDWDLVKCSVNNFVNLVWEHPTNIAQVNQMNICLIPKVHNPEFVSQFRPIISLCNTLYKVNKSHC